MGWGGDGGGGTHPGMHFNDHCCFSPQKGFYFILLTYCFIACSSFHSANSHTHCLYRALADQTLFTSNLFLYSTYLKHFLIV